MCEIYCFEAQFLVFCIAQNVLDEFQSQTSTLLEGLSKKYSELSDGAENINPTITTNGSAQQELLHEVLSQEMGCGFFKQNPNLIL